MNRFKKFTLAIALVLLATLVVVATAVVHHYQLKVAVARYRAELKAQGEPLELAQVIPPPVPDASNSVAAVREAFSRMNLDNVVGINITMKVPHIMKMVAPGKALTSWQQPEVVGYEYGYHGQFTNSWTEFAADMATNRIALEPLYQVLERPKLDFQLDYTNNVLLPHLMPMKYAVRLLEVATVLDLHKGDSGAAATNILIMLALVQRNEGEATLPSHLMHVATADIAVATTWEYLQSPQVTEAQLAALQKGWEQLNFFRDAEPAFTMERVIYVDGVKQRRASHQSYANCLYFGSGDPGNWNWWSLEDIKEKAQDTIVEIMWRSTWSYAEEQLILQSCQVALEALRAMQTNATGFYKRDYDVMISRLPPSELPVAGEGFFRLLGILDRIGGTPLLECNVPTILRAETARQITVTAIALKRYQLRHGQLPETLAALVPEFMPSVPIDPFDGQPLKYRRHADGTFLLYSVAENGVDDGGDPSAPTSPGTRPNWQWQNSKALDWVWPQPATAAEIQAFLEPSEKAGK